MHYLHVGIFGPKNAPDAIILYLFSHRTLLVNTANAPTFYRMILRLISGRDGAPFRSALIRPDNVRKRYHFRYVKALCFPKANFGPKRGITHPVIGKHDPRRRVLTLATTEAGRMPRGCTKKPHASPFTFRTPRDVWILQFRA